MKLHNLHTPHNLSSFTNPLEKGRAEWNAFNIIADDTVSRLTAYSAYVPYTRTLSAIRFGTSDLFTLKRA